MIAMDLIMIAWSEFEMYYRLQLRRVDPLIFLDAWPSVLG